MRISAFVTKLLYNRNSHVGYSIFFMGQLKLDMSNLINSNVNLFMYLI